MFTSSPLSRQLSYTNIVESWKLLITLKFIRISADKPNLILPRAKVSSTLCVIQFSARCFRFSVFQLLQVSSTVFPPQRSVCLYSAEFPQDLCTLSLESLSFYRGTIAGEAHYYLLVPRHDDDGIKQTLCRR
jgi:hypothetical protein